MADLLAQALAWLEAQRTLHRTQTVTYRRGEVSIPVPATVGRTIFKLDDGAGGVLRIESRDYLILVADLSVGLPERGDQIVETVDGQAFAYEVTAPGGEPHWRYSDPYRQTLRIHSTFLERT